MAIPSPALTDEHIQQQVVNERDTVSNGWGALPRSTPMPDYVKDRIVTVLIRGALIDARRITVTAAGRCVILTGAVRSWAGRQEAERVVWSAPGVIQVENHITVLP